MSTTLIARTALPERYQLASRAEAAAELRIAVVTLDGWIRRGLLPIVRVNSRVLIRRSVLSAYLDALNGITPDRRPPHPPPSESEHLLFTDAVHLFRIHRNTLDNLTRAGELPRIRWAGRRVVPAAAVAAYIDRSSVPASNGPLAGYVA